MWVADNDPKTAEYLETVPLIQYFYLLNKKVRDTQPKK